MKKILALVLALCMALSLCACGNSAAPAATEAPAAEAPAAETPAEEAPAAEAPAEVDYSAMTLDELKAILTTVADGKLTVATSPDFAPYEFYAIDADGNPQLAGFDMALAQYIADFLGLELDVIPMDFDGVLAELGNGSVDIGLAGLSPDPEREDSMDFSDIYYMGGQSFVTTVANKDTITGYEMCNNKDYSIGAQTGSIQYNKLALVYTPEADIVNLPKVTDIIQDLLAGNLDGAFIETVVAQNYAVNYPDLYVVCDVPYDVAGSAVGVMEGNQALTAAINLAIAACIADGSMNTFIEEASNAASGEIIEGLLEG